MVPKVGPKASLRGAILGAIASILLRDRCVPPMAAGCLTVVVVIVVVV